MQRAKNKRNKKTQVNKKFRIGAIALSCLILAGVSLTVYSKYYKTGYNKGMAIASGFYFSSNYMAAVDEIKGLDMEQIAADYADLIIVSSNSNAWKGTDAFSFNIEIWNYDNQLLYNDKDLNVEYKVCFMLLEEPKGATYTVTDGSNNSYPLEWNNGKGSVMELSGKLAGGQPRTDTYTLTVGMTSASDYAPASVLMVAYPTGPDYLVNTKYIAGIVKANYEDREFKIESGTGFTVSKTQDYKDDWKGAVEKESGFVYQLITSGNYTGSEATATRKKIRLMWDSDMFKINENDDYYQSVKNNVDQYYDDPKDGINWKVMEIEVLPYSSLKFVFFRNDNFDSKLASMTQNGFEESVKAEVLTN